MIEREEFEKWLLDKNKQITELTAKNKELEAELAEWKEVGLGHDENSRQAIKQLAELTSKLDKARDGDCCTEGCIKCDARKVLAETQEPVTHVIGLDNDGKEVVVKLQKPLYTTPPSREWVGLSDEEIDIIDEATWDEDHKVWGIHDFARAIEAKLRDKNTWLI
jgi:hypothetical protein